MSEDVIETDVLIVGCGLSGLTIADRFAREKDMSVLIVEKRNHIGGNVYDEIDENGILVSRYGAHLFHTDSERVWAYVNRFAEWVRWEHKVLAHADGRLVPVPVNITTINALCGTSLRSEDEARAWLDEHQELPVEIRNSEDMALSRVGRRLYERLFRPYTVKQWGKEPAGLDPSVLARIPVRCSFDDRYFSDRYQALPRHGYTEFCRSMLDHPKIRVLLDTDFFEVRDRIRAKLVFYTGPIDRYFGGLPPLEYRSLRFETIRLRNVPFFQPNSVINYPSPDVPYTRIVEYKHFLHQESPHTTIVRETSTDEGEPFYPVPNPENQALYARYKALADREIGVYFAGRLAGYKYYNMDQAILAALELCDRLL